MSDDANRTGQVSSTPEAGPIEAGTPSMAPGSGQVRSTPEAAPLGEGEELVPPTWQEHMAGPIPGLDDIQPMQTTARDHAQPAMTPPIATSAEDSPPIADWKGVPTTSAAAADRQEADEELRKWPPYSGKPVSEPGWNALKYAAPIVSQAEKIAIKTIDLSGRGLSNLARFLDARRKEREQKDRSGNA